MQTYAMSPGYALAPEILDQIFQHFFIYYQLHACTLTCKAWYASANRALFLLDARRERYVMGYAMQNERPEAVARMLSYPKYFNEVHELATAIRLGRDTLIDAMLSSATFTTAWLASSGHVKYGRYPLIEAMWKDNFKTALKLIDMGNLYNVNGTTRI